MIPKSHTGAAAVAASLPQRVVKAEPGMELGYAGFRSDGSWRRSFVVLEISSCGPLAV